MEKRALSDPDLYPSEEVLASHLGRSKAAFAAMLELNRAEHPDFEERWKYYNDGKSWLFNVSRKKKTLFWLSVAEGYFTTSFYLNAKAEEPLMASTAPEELKAQYRASADKKLHGVTLVLKAKKDLEVYKELLAIKMATM